jgi:hypothetical protein
MITDPPAPEPAGTMQTLIVGRAITGIGAFS